MLGLHWLDWVVLGLYFVGILGIGLWSYLRVKNTSDYFMGGRRFGKVLMMFFAFGVGTSSEQAVSVAAGSFRNGLAGIWYQFCGCGPLRFTGSSRPCFDACVR